MVTFSLNFIVTKSLGLNIFYKRDCILKKIMYNVGNLGTFRRMVMKKTVTFTDKDKTLVERLEKYKKVKGYKSLIQVVRDLCDDALTLKEISK